MRVPVRWAGGRAAWGLCGLCLALNLLAIGFALARPGGSAVDAMFPVVSQTFPVLGAVVAGRRPEHRMGWLYLFAGVLLAVGNALTGYALLPETGSVLPLSTVAGWVAAWTIPPTFAAIAFLFLLFPDGRLPSPTWRGFAWGYGGLTAGCAASVAVLPGELFGVKGVGNPVGWDAIPRAWSEPVFHVVLLVATLGLVVSVVSMAPRFLGGDPVRRAQLKWMLYAAALVAVAWLGFAVLTALWGRHAAWLVVPATLATATVPICGAVAILRHRLFDIDRLIGRSVVYGVLWLLIGVGYLATVAGLGIAAGRLMPVHVAVAVAILATLVFQPLRRRVDRVARRLVLGERLTGEQVLQRFGETLEHAFDLTELAPRIAVAVRYGLGLRWARVLLRFDAGETALLRPAGSSGLGAQQLAAAELTVPLSHGGAEVGALECGPKTEGDSITVRERELLTTLGRQAALAIHNARLAGELAARLDEIRHQAEEIRASRARIVHAQDTERRRIERDLHDGIQQELVALKTRIRLVRNQIHDSPGDADAMLGKLQLEVGEVIGELRELARGIHPPVLTDQGLVAAAQARAATLPIGVQIRAEPAAAAARFGEHIEATGYFIISEALANVLKHAAASTATVQIDTTPSGLRIEVSDDGCGFDPGDAVGSGLTGLRDRAEAVGGRFVVASRPGGGTSLVAELPAPGRKAPERKPREREAHEREATDA